MTKIGTVGKVVVGAVVAAVLIVLVIASQNQPSQNQPNGSGTNNNASSTGPNGGTAAPGAGAAQTSGGQAGGGQLRTQANVSLRSPMVFVAPVPGEAWKIGTQNTIAWNREGGISGDIYLIDAETRRFVGVILPQVGPHQTSYAWNTRDVLLDRTSPLKKDILPGTYIVKIAFDGNNLPVIASPAVVIVR